MFSSAKRLAIAATLLIVAATTQLAHSQQTSNWVTSWTASSHGPYPLGSAVALPDQRFALPDPASGAHDQSFRMIVRPTVWGSQTRLRFSNVFGTQPLKLDDVFVGLQLSSAVIVPGTNVPVKFSGRKDVSIAPGTDIWSDAIDLPFATNTTTLAGRKLAVSFHVVGTSGPMTWHAKAMQTSYISLPQSGSHSGEEAEQSFPSSTTAWFFLSALDMRMPTRTPLVVCFGDSITDGTASTLNGDDRWPDVLARHFASVRANSVAVANAGIGGNRVISPATYTAQTPFSGGPAALQRINRDVAGLSGVTTVIWFEGINDLSHHDSANDIIEGFKTGVTALRKAIPGVRIVGATITTAFGAKSDSGTEEVNQRRKAINDAIRSGNLFDAYVDFDQATVDPQSGSLKPEFIPNSTVGGPGDSLHPNRAGYQAMANAISLATILPGFAPLTQGETKPNRKQQH